MGDHSFTHTHRYVQGDGVDLPGIRGRLGVLVIIILRSCFLLCRWIRADCTQRYAPTLQALCLERATGMSV